MLFIVIWGSKGITHTAESGTFHCPSCGPSHGYRHRRCRRFFTLYWIPLIPMNVVGEYIECDHCQGTYKMGVLDYDPDRGKKVFEAEFAQAVKQVLVRMVLADGTIDPAEIGAMSAVYRKVTGGDLSEVEVMELADGARRFPASLIDVLQDLAAMLNDHGKAMVLQAAFYIAVSDGHLDPREEELLTAIGEALEMSEREVSEVVGSLMQAA